MTPDEQANAAEVVSVVQSVRNLRPKAFALATDLEADIKARWTAFDELYEAVRQALREKHLFPDDVLTTKVHIATLPESMIEEATDRACRISVAMNLLLARYGTSEAVQATIMLEAEALVPTPPNPDTGMPGISIKDSALLRMITEVLADQMHDDWMCFFRGDSELPGRRKQAFHRLYLVVGKAWMRDSLFAQSMQPIHRQRMITIALMCYVPKDQWSQADLEELWAEILPVEEPDWNDETIFGPA